jgi:predicted MPP superfamily phosphohydrolase
MEGNLKSGSAPFAGSTRDLAPNPSLSSGSLKRRRFSRRHFIFLSFLAAPGLAYGDASWVEPNWVKTRFINLAGSSPTHRVVHITDIHHKGDRAYLEGVVAKINRLSPDVVCFTGDLIEDAHYIPEALDILRKIKSPVYGVPGNHDYWSNANFSEMGKSFATTGGAWLMDDLVLSADRKLQISGLTCLGGRPVPIPIGKGVKNIMMLHFPLIAEQVQTQYDLLLAGHSHGGQVRLPFYGAFVLPYWVGKYDQGMFRVPAGRLYVNPGLGWLVTRLRFNCRPEITVFDI